MYKRICPLCGRETKKLIDGLCPECYEKINKKEEKKKKYKVCKYCGRVLYKNKWVYMDVEEFEYTVCPKCLSLLNPTQYNYIIQLRGSKEKIDIVIKEIKSIVYVKQEKDVENGKDLYLYLNRKEFNKVYKIIRKYTKNVKITRKVIGYNRQESKYKYRVSVSVRL